MNVSLSLLSCGVYILKTYEDHRILSHLEIGLTGFFLFDYALRLYVADQRLEAMLSPTMLIDLLTIAPGLIDIVSPESQDFARRRRTSP